MEMIPVYGEQEHYADIAEVFEKASKLAYKATGPRKIKVIGEISPYPAKKAILYSAWCEKLIETAIQNHGYAYSVVEPNVSGHAYQQYFEEGLSPDEAIRKARF